MYEVLSTINQWGYKTISKHHVGDLTTFLEGKTRWKRFVIGVTEKVGHKEVVERFEYNILGDSHASMKISNPYWFEKGNTNVDKNVGRYVHMHEIKFLWILDHHLLGCSIW